jgi:hypothetical protein
MLKQLLFHTLVLLSLQAFAQNVVGEFTARDFEQRNSTRLRWYSTQVDTLTGREEEELTLEAFYNPRTKIVSVQQFNPVAKHYEMTDSLNLLYEVNWKGIPDTANYPQLKKKWNTDRKVLHVNEAFLFFNEKGQLVRMLTDTTLKGLIGVDELRFFYEGDSLKNSVRKFHRVYYQPNGSYLQNPKPETLIEVLYDSNKETETSNYLEPSSSLWITFVTVTEKTGSSIISRTYYKGKLLEIRKIVFS